VPTSIREIRLAETSSCPERQRTVLTCPSVGIEGARTAGRRSRKKPGLSTVRSARFASGSM